VKVGLESYTFSFSAGLGWPERRREHVPYSLYGLLDKAAGAGLAGLSFPLERVDEGELPRLKAYAAERGLFLNAATGGTDPERLGRLLDMASRLGCSILRTVIGGAKIGGDRRPMRGKWAAFMAKTLEDLKQLAPVAEAQGFSLALENHQDLTSDELIGLLREVASPAVGIVLDVANPLGTGEDPETFYKKVMPYLKGAHLKDYTVHLTASGYLLARCALGRGVIDFPRLFQDFRHWHPRLQPTVELGALEARHIRVLEDDFWEEYPERPAREFARTWRFVNDHAAPADLDWRTPLERDEGEEALLAYEEAQFQESARYIKRLLKE
jgi:3-oxoisoapionate decarboxylase